MEHRNGEPAYFIQVPKFCMYVHCKVWLDIKAT